MNSSVLATNCKGIFVVPYLSGMSLSCSLFDHAHNVLLMMILTYLLQNEFFDNHDSLEFSKDTKQSHQKMPERLTYQCMKNIASILVTLIEVDGEDLTFQSKCFISADLGDLSKVQST